MQCEYFDAGACRSCTLMGTPYAAALAAKQERAAEVLGAHVPAGAWREPFASRESGFRNKAKLVVGGTPQAPTLGILGPDARGVDLRGCGLYEPALAATVPVLADFVAHARLRPYDVAARTGELKHVLATVAPTGELMVRFVLRSEGQLGRIRRELAWLAERLPSLAVASVNLQPEHKAVLEGAVEHVLTGADTLPMGLGDGLPTLHLRPASFFQTNTAVATGLYEQARAWVADVAPETLWDLYCGVGGFALACAGPGREVLGVEVSPDAVASARRSAADAGLAARFVTGDATAHALGADVAPELVIVNPPRRGIGESLARWLEDSGVPHVVYSSCNAESLAADLARMPTLRVVAARLFDMFPQSTHSEVMVLLGREP